MRVLRRAPAGVRYALAVLAAVWLVGGACRQPTEEEKLVQARSRYEATLNNFIVTQVPLVEEQPADEVVEGAEDAAVDEPGDAEAAAEDQTGDAADAETLEDVPVRQDVVVDITIRHESQHPLDGITIDFFMSDGTTEIRNWRIWFDTTSVQGDTPGVQFSHTFEDVDYQEGYGFYAEVSSSVPVDERDEYREFAGL